MCCDLNQAHSCCESSLSCQTGHTQPAQLQLKTEVRGSQVACDSSSVTVRCFTMQ